MGNVRENIRGNKIVFYLILALSVVISVFLIGDNENVAQAKPNKKNPDAYLRSSGSINNDIYKVDWLRKSHFRGNSFSNRYIHEAQRDEGYTCWAYNASNYDFHQASIDRHPFWGSVSRGNEAYGETMEMEQCKGGKKLIEYEIHASDNISNASYNPSMSNATVSGKRANYLRFTGWATLGGFTHHSGWNQSTYIAAVEQVNGKNTTSSNGVHITKAVANTTNLTNHLKFGRIPRCQTSSATGRYTYEQGKDYNRYRGSLFYSSVRRGDPSVLSFYGNTASEDPNAGALVRHYRANERWYRTFFNPDTRKDYNHPVHGLGCNFDYPYAGFTAYVNMDDLLGNGETEKDFKLYLVKRVEDMIVATEMQTPQYTEEMRLKHGTVSFEGYDKSNTVRPNRTALPRFSGYNSSSWLLSNRYGSGYLNMNRNYRLDRVIVRSGYPSIYKIRDTSAGRTFYHYAHYFNYNQQGEGSTLKYEIDEKPVRVRHYDFYTCPTNVQNNISGNGLSNLTGTTCKQVRERSTGNLAQKGDKWYKVGQRHTFYTYQGSEVYRTSKSKDDFRNMMNNRKINVIGNGTGHVNFFYINQAEVGSLRVNYIDNQTGDALRSPHTVSQVKIGKTVSYRVPDPIVADSGRYYYPINNPSDRTRITGDNVVNIKYNPNPRVYFDLIDRSTGDKLDEVYNLHQRGTNFSKTPPSTVKDGGTTYYREESGPIRFNSLWDDKRIKVYYTDKKRVIARHYDYYSCPESERDSRTGNLANTSCIALKEKSNGNTADKGTGNFRTNTEQKFYPYSNSGNLIYKDNKSRDKYNAVYPHSLSVNLSGMNTTYVNFFYINDRDLGNLRVKYVDAQSGDTLRSDYVKTGIKKGNTTSYTLPSSIRHDGRTYYLRSNHDGNIKITKDNHTITVKYNYNPNIYIKKVDRDTNKVLGTDKRHVNRGGTYNMTPDEMITDGGSNFYREGSGSIQFSNVWDDTTKTEYYSKYKDVTVRHYDYYSCDLSEAENMLGLIEGMGCSRLFEKDTGAWTFKGSGRYETDMEHKFWKYANVNDNLYRTDRVNDSYYAENASSQVVMLRGKNETFINFFYKNRLDEFDLTVEYINRQTGEKLRNDYKQTRIGKGTTVDYPMPDILRDGSRPLYRYGNQTGKVRMTGNRTITVKYNYNPDVTIRKVDRDTGQLLGTYTDRITRGTNFNYTPTENIQYDGSSYYRENSGAVKINNLWKDTTTTEYYSKYKDVSVRHYDYYSCDLSEAENMLGNIGNSDCIQLKEKGNGSLADVGSGRYETDMSHRFWKYGNIDNRLYNTNRSLDSYYAENASSQVIQLTGKNKSYINFFYKNRRDEASLTVNYEDRQTGKTLRKQHVETNIYKGTTVSYPMPETIIGDDGRYYYRYGNQTGRAVVNSDREITVKYNYNPIVTVNYIDRETGNTIQPSTEHVVTRGNNFNSNTPTELRYDNNPHFRVGGERQISNLWRDTTITFEYSDMRDVIVNAYDRKERELNNRNVSLREKSSRNIARQGSGAYKGNISHRFTAYGNNLLYRNSVSENYFLDTRRESNVQNVNVPLSYQTLNSGNPYHVNFYYTNRDDVRTVQVRYRTTSYNGERNAKFIADHDTFYDRFHGTNITRSELSNSNIINHNGRTYDYENGTLPSRIAILRGTGTQVEDLTYNIRPHITLEYYDRDRNRVIRTETQEVRYGSNWTHNWTEHFTSSGTTYTSYEEPKTSRLNNVMLDTTVRVEYTDKSLTEMPEHYFEMENATDGLTDVDKLNWRITEDDLITETSAEISGNHAHIFSANVREFYGTGDFDTTNNTSTSYKTSESYDETEVGEGYSNSETIDKNDDDAKLSLNYEYTYTNIMSSIFECDYGTSDRCFEWEIVDAEPNTTDTGQVEVDGNMVDVRETYNLTVELENDIKLNKEVGIGDFTKDGNRYTYDTEIGKTFVGSDNNEGENELTNGTYSSDNSSDRDKFRSDREEFTIDNLELEPTGENELETQQSKEFNEDVEYDYFTGNSSIDLNLEDTNVTGTYTATLDKNLQDTLDTEEVDGIEKSTIDVRYDSSSNQFKLGKVFGLSKKYGIQVAVDYEDYMDDNEILETELNNELERLGLSNDELVELDYEKSRYFVPIDDPNYLVGDVFEDTIVMEGLGVTDIEIEYNKDFEYSNYLYGSVSEEFECIDIEGAEEDDDCEVVETGTGVSYVSQKEYPESVGKSEEEIVYPSHERHLGIIGPDEEDDGVPEVISDDELEDIATYSEENSENFREKINLFRIIDDIDLDNFIRNIQE